MSIHHVAHPGQAPVEDPKPEKSVQACKRDGIAALAVLSNMFRDVALLEGAAGYERDPATLESIAATFIERPSKIPDAAFDLGARELLRAAAISALPSRRSALAVQLKAVAQCVQDGDLFTPNVVEAFAATKPDHHLPSNIIEQIEVAKRNLR